MLLILGADLAFTLMSGLVRAFNTIDAVHFTLARFLVGAVLVSIAWATGIVHIGFHNKPWLFVRGFFGAIAVGLLFVTITTLGVGKATLINYTYPVFATLLGAWLLKDSVTLRQWLAMAIAFSGIVLLLAPTNAEAWHIGWWEAIGLFGAITAGIAVMSIKRLHSTDNTPSIFLAHCVIGMAVVAPFSFFMDPAISPIHATSAIANTPTAPAIIGFWLPLLAVGLLATLGQLLMTQGYRTLSVAQASTLGLLVPFLNSLQGWWFFGETLSWLSLLGGSLALGGCWLLFRNLSK